MAAARAFLAFERGEPLAEAPPAGLRDEAERRLYSQLLLGLVRHKRLLEDRVARLARGATRPDPPVAALAMLGWLQLHLLDGIPPHAAIHETVEAAGALGCGRAKGWINGVLRSAQREGPPEWEALPPAVRTSHPDWMVARWSARYGVGAAAAICEANNRFAGSTVRVETARLTPEAARDELAGEGIEAAAHPAVAGALTVAHTGTLVRSHAFRAGHLYVQDAAALLLTAWAARELAEPVLDACAAPGGKLTHLRRLLPEGARLFGADRPAGRLVQVRENLARLRTPAVPLLRADAACLPLRDEALGAVVLDVPCMSTGMIRKYPDIKWRKRESDLAGYVATQRAMLAEAARVLRPGGRLLYVTCSLEPEENEGQVDAFLAARRDFRRLRFREPPRDVLARASEAPVTHAGDFQTLPDARWMGLYAALLEKSARERGRRREGR